MTNLPSKVLLFVGHRLDSPDRPQPRFPAGAEAPARRMIEQGVVHEVESDPKAVLGLAGGACGSDLIFHEVCAEMGVPTRLMVAGERADVVEREVAVGGPEWVVRFDRVYGQGAVTRLDPEWEEPAWLQGSAQSAVPGGRATLWKLSEAAAYGPERVTLLALWNGDSEDPTDGTGAAIELAENRGIRTVVLDASELLTPRS